MTNVTVCKRNCEGNSDYGVELYFISGDDHIAIQPSRGCIVDPALELSDPTPDIHKLFWEYNARFFWGKLSKVKVEWSNRLTSSVGDCICRWENGEIVIRLSSHILSLRPRRDLVETLLHEMIHAYLFITDDDDNRKEHGPVYKFHMNRINEAANTNITVDHEFYEEVDFYKQHSWLCNGPCRNQPPHYGYVRRTRNRRPGPKDAWWNKHQSTCGGAFIKVSSPLSKTRKSGSTKGSHSDSRGKENTGKRIASLPNPSMPGSVNEDKNADTAAAATHSDSEASTTRISCPVCNELVKEVFLQWHLSLCMEVEAVFTDSFSPPEPKAEGSHSDSRGKENRGKRIASLPNPSMPGSFNEDKNADTAVAATHSDSEASTTRISCPVCNELVKEVFLQWHLSLCMEDEAAFTDSFSPPEPKAANTNLCEMKDEDDVYIMGVDTEIIDLTNDDDVFMVE